MDKVCVRCARRTLSHRAVARAQVGSRNFSVSLRPLDGSRSGDSGVAQSGKPIANALGQQRSTSQAQRPLLRQASESAQPSLIRKTSAPRSEVLTRRSEPGKDNQGRPQTQGPLLRRSSSPQTGQVLRRAGPAGSSPSSNRGGVTGAVGRTAGPRPAGTLLRRPGQGQGQDRRLRQQGTGNTRQQRPDRRRRTAPKEDEDELDAQNVNQQMEEYISKYVDRPANPTEPLPYKPSKLTLDDLRSDWPNTPLSTSGMTESVIQKVAWLARRLPHGYQSPEQIAEHYLKGNLTRFESNEEREMVLKLASELSAKTKTESEDGTLHKHETPRFAIVEEPTFTSLASKAGDKGHLMNTTIKGDYGQAQQQKYAFMQSAGRILGNNETYGPVQSEKLLARVQALIPQGKAGGAQPVKKA